MKKGMLMILNWNFMRGPEDSPQTTTGLSGAGPRHPAVPCAEAGSHPAVLCAEAGFFWQVPCAEAGSLAGWDPSNSASGVCGDMFSASLPELVQPN